MLLCNYCVCDARSPRTGARHGRRCLSDPCLLCVWLCQELRATNETLRTLQMQLEKAIHTPSPSSSTYKAIMETKDARIANLEKEVALLERELQRTIVRDSGSALLLGSPAPLVLAAPTDAIGAPPPPLSLPLQPVMPVLPPQKHDTSFKRQVSFLLNNVQIRKDGKVTVIM